MKGKNMRDCFSIENPPVICGTWSVWIKIKSGREALTAQRRELIYN